MGAGASTEENRQALKHVIYTSAAKIHEGAPLEEEEGEDYEDSFPGVCFNRFMRGKIAKEEMELAVSSWAQKQQAESDEDESTRIWREALRAVQGDPKPKAHYLKALKCVFDVLGAVVGKDAELILTVGLQVSQMPEFAYAVLESLPEVQTIHSENAENMERLMEFYPSYIEAYGSSWALQVWQEEVLPRAKEAIVKRLQEKDDEGRCKVIFEHFDGCMLFSIGEWLRLGGDPTGVMDAADAEEFVQLDKEVHEYWKGWPAHLELVRAIGTGDASAMAQWLDKANINEDAIDGDSKTASLLVLSTQKCWQPRWSNTLLERQLLKTPSYSSCVWLPKDSLEIFKILLARPDIDPNVGAYSYGWHGSHVRATPLGMVLMDDLDTGCCEHRAEGDNRLVAPRREIVSLLADDPRVDLEDVFFEHYEEGGDVWLSALTHLECKGGADVDLATAMILMQAGALMSRGWVQILEELDQGLRPDLNEQLEQQLIEEREEEDNAQTLEETSLGGYTLVQDGSHRLRMKKSEVLKSRIQEGKEVKEWYTIVKKGSNVFESPKSFPPNFCRVAHALDSAFRKLLGRPVVGHILSFLPFFEFNRRRVPRSRFHKEVDKHFGRPLPSCIYRMDQFQRKIRDKLEAEEEEALEDCQPWEAQGEEPEGKEGLPEINETCWAQDTSLKYGKAACDDE